MSSPTASKITSALAQCKFNPKTDSNMKIIADVDNLDYYLHRANEEVQKAINTPEKKQMVINAIQVLALALLKIEDQFYDKGE